MKKKIVVLLILVAMLFMTACGGASQQNEKSSEAQESQTSATQASTGNGESFILATTTSTQDSVLLDVLVPVFEEQTGFVVKTIAVGTGKALEMGSNGEADVLLVHAPDAEQKLIDNESAINRQLVMHNDFVIVGPTEDPADIKGVGTAKEAFEKIMNTNSIFVSRGDDSGTNKMELALWKSVEFIPEGQWYQETGQGMGGTLRVASEKSGYTLTDRATYLALMNEIDSEILVEGDEELLNIYHVMQVNPEKFENIKAEQAKAFVDFLVAEDTQKVIGEFGVEEYGQPLFFPDAGK